MSLLLCILLGFALWFIIRIISGLYRLRSFFNQAAAGPTPRQSSGRKGGWSAPLRRRKKIDPKVGEYVRFTETETTVEKRTDSHTQTTIVEDQVTDIDWEDLPSK